MKSVFWGMTHLNSNVLAAVTIEMTNQNPLLGELIEVCVLPLNHMLQPHSELTLFNMRIRPEDKDSVDCRLTGKQVADLVLNGYDREKVASLMLDWFYTLDLKERKKILPIGHEWPRTREVLKTWLGDEIYSEIFSEDYRDTKIATHFLNDQMASRGESVPYAKQGLPWLASKLHVQRQSQGGNCTEDALVIGEVYRRLLCS